MWTHLPVIIPRMRVLADKVCVHEAGAKVNQDEASQCHASICSYCHAVGLQQVQLLLLTHAVTLQFEECRPRAEV